MTLYNRVTGSRIHFYGAPIYVSPNSYKGIEKLCFSVPLHMGKNKVKKVKLWHAPMDAMFWLHRETQHLSTMEPLSYSISTLLSA